MNKVLLLMLVVVSMLTACKEEKKPEEQVQELEVITGIPTIDGATAKIDADPTNAALYAERAAAYYANQGYDEAINDYRQAILLDSLNTDYYINLSDVYLDYFKSFDALRMMSDAVIAFPDNVDVLLQKARIHLIVQQYDEALHTLEVVKSKEPRNTEMFFLAGHVFKEQGEVEPAIVNFQTAVEEDPELIDGWLMLGDLWSVKQKEFAATYYDNALRIDSTNVDALLKKAYYVGTIMGDIEEALAINRKLIRINPQMTGPYFNSGLLLMDQNKYEEALQQFSLAIRFDPASGKAYYYKGVASEKLGRLEDARANYLSAMSFEPNEPAIREGLDRVKKLMK